MFGADAFSELPFSTFPATGGGGTTITLPQAAWAWHGDALLMAQTATLPQSAVNWHGAALGLAASLALPTKQLPWVGNALAMSRAATLPQAPVLGSAAP